MENKINGLKNLYLVYKQDGDLEGAAKIAKQIKELESSNVKEEKSKEEQVKEFTYYSVYGSVDKNDKSIKLMGNTLDFEVTEYSSEKIVKLSPKQVQHILNVEWELNKSFDFIMKLTKKLTKMYKEMI